MTTNKNIPSSPTFTEHEVRRGLRWSITASAIGVMFFQLLTPTGLLAVGIMLAQGVTKFQIGILAATLPLARFAEITASYAMQRTGRRRELFTWTHLVSRLLWVPLVLTYYLPQAAAAWRVPVLFVILLASSLLAWTGSNAWLSWMGDLIPTHRRGRYFGIRQVIMRGVAIVAGLAIGFFLRETPPYEHLVLVVCVLVGFGIADILIFRYLVPHPALAPTRRGGQLRELISTALGDRRYRRLVAFIAAWYFSSGLMMPYLWVFIKGEDYLNLGYRFGYVNLAISGACLMGMSYFWSRRGDRWRARPALALSAVIGAVSPFLYSFATRTFTLPIVVAWAVGSVAWAGILVLSFQYSISLAPAKERSIYLAFHSAVTGLITAAAFLSADAIVWALQWVTLPWGLCDLQALFWLSGLGRALTLIAVARLDDTPRS